MANNGNGVCFVWKIENFSMLPHQVGEKLESPKFVIDAVEKVYIYFRLYPKGETDDDRDKISLFLYKMPIDQDLKLDFYFNLEAIFLSEVISRSYKNEVFNEEGRNSCNLFSNVHKIYAHKLFYLPQDTLTIRCEVVIPNLAKFFMKPCVSRTCIAVHRRTITWPIHNIKKCIERQKKCDFILQSSLKNLPSLKLTLNFGEISMDDNCPILIEQTCLSSDEEQLFVKCKITVINANGKYQDFKERSHLFELNLNDVWHFPSFIKASMLTNDQHLYVDDTLFLRCEFAFSYKDKIFHLESTYRPLDIKSMKEIPINELSRCLKNIHENAEFCDVELHADGKTFPYYKAILCARSAVFKNDMKEKNTNVVEILDVDSDTLEKMLEFMHSDLLDNHLPPENAIKLYKAANKYCIESLKRRCSILLSSAVSLVNVCDLLTLADVHHDEFLMIAVHDFMGNHVYKIFHSMQWRSFLDSNPKLAATTMQKIFMGKFHL